MAINKVIYGNDTLIDLTSDTVEAGNLLSGETAHDRSGAQITGTATADTLDAVAYTAQTGRTANEKATARSNIGAMAADATPVPAAHASTHAANGSDPITPASIGAMAAGATPTPAAHHTTHEAGGSDEITLPTASTSGAGIVQLYDGVDSDSTTLAATAAAVKAAYNHGGGGGTQANWAETDPLDPSYIQNKPTSMTPTAHASSHAAGGTDEVTPAAIGAATDDHVHGNITNGGALQDTDVSVATGDKLLIADASDGGKAARSDIAFEAGDTKKFLSAEGAFRTPIELAANVVTNLNDASHSDNSAIRFYCFTSSSTNNPGYAGFCLYYSHAYPKGVQYAFNLDNAKISRRSRSSDGTWGNWSHIT